MKLALLALAAMTMFATQASAQAASQSLSEVRAARQACRTDAQKLCPGKRGPEARDCLTSAGDKVSQSCRDALAKLQPPKS